MNDQPLHFDADENLFSEIEKIPFSEVLEALLDESTPVRPRYLYELSDVSPENLPSLAQAWGQISSRRRQALMEDLFELTESDLVLSFEAVCTLALTDQNAHVRTLAVRMLNEYEDPAYLPDFLRLVDQDPDDSVRAAATSALGVFVYLGEVDELSPGRLQIVEECLLRLVNSQEAPLLRQRALESLGYSSRPDVSTLIDRAYHSEDPAWLASALNAMGRSADSRWNKPVMAKLDHPQPAVRAEAVSAAGELEISSARSSIVKLLEDHDIDVRMAAIWALSQIGGEGVRTRLERRLKQADNDAETDMISAALDNLVINEGDFGFSLIDVDEVDLEDEDDLVIEEIPEDDIDDDDDDEDEDEDEDYEGFWDDEEDEFDDEDEDLD